MFTPQKNKKPISAMEEEGRRFSRANRGSRMAVLLSEAMEAQAGGSFPRWALLSPRPACAYLSSRAVLGGKLFRCLTAQHAALACD